MPPRDLTLTPTLDPVEAVTRRELLTALPAFALLAAGVSCGGDDDGGPAPATKHVIETPMGPVEIPAHPERIVADSVSTFAHLVALDIEPVGVAIPEDIPTSYFRPANDTIPNVVASDGWTIDIEKALQLDAEPAGPRSASRRDSITDRQRPLTLLAGTSCQRAANAIAPRNGHAASCGHARR